MATAGTWRVEVTSLLDTNVTLYLLDGWLSSRLEDRLHDYYSGRKNNGANR